MPLDKELYRLAYAQYREWNRAEATARARHARELPAVETWHRYAALVELCWRLSPEQSARQRRQRLADWDRYYERVERLERWRKTRAVSP
jgi:hypothetical protein